MQIMQRIILIIGIAMLIVCGNGIAYREKGKIYLEQWEELQIENFIENICRTGVLSYDELLVLTYLLNNRDIVICRLEEYKKEQDLLGKIYRYRISWQEVSEILEKQNVYTFQNGSIVQIEIYRKNPSREQLYRYCGVVWKEWDNDV